MEERRAKVDSMTSEYIHHQRAGSCLREFTRQVFRPNPDELGLLGFGGRNASGFATSWIVKEERVMLRAGDNKVGSAGRVRE